MYMHRINMLCLKETINTNRSSLLEQKLHIIDDIARQWMHSAILNRSLCSEKSPKVSSAVWASLCVNPETASRIEAAGLPLKMVSTCSTIQLFISRTLKLNLLTPRPVNGFLYARQIHALLHI